MKKKLIITADDYGLSENVNKGTIKAVEKGTVTSVHVLTNMASDQDILDLAAAIRESGNKCGIGLHLNMNEGESMRNRSTTITRLNKESKKYEFYPISEYNYDDTNGNDVIKELEKQYKKLDRLIGAANIDSISSHYNLHVFSKKFVNYVQQLAKRHNTPLRSPVQWRTIFQKPKTNKYHPLELSKIGWNTRKNCQYRSTKKLLLNAANGKRLKKHRKKLQKVGPVPNNTSGHWMGQPGLDKLKWTYNELKNDINVNSYCTEIFLHLSNSDEWSGKPLTYPMSRRLEEFNEITSEDVVNFCANLYRNDNHVELGSYRKLLCGQSITY